MAAFTTAASEFQGFQGLTLPDETQPRLYIGPKEALSDPRGLQRQGITHILSVMEGASAFQVDAGFTRLLLDTALDDPAFDLQSWWPSCCDFINGALGSGGSVLLHCDAGSSRSGATLVAYLIHRLQQPAGECLAMAQRTRIAVSPNEGFWAQLLSWERKCLGSVSLATSRMHEVRPGLWLGSLEAAQDWQRLQEQGIRHVITCGRGLETCLPEGVTRELSLKVDDLDEVDILEHLPPASDILDQLLSRMQSVLVHCAMGRSRSAAVVIAYVMRKEHLSYTEALSSVQAVRPEVLPNTGFSRQLAWYASMGCPADLRDSAGTSYRELAVFSKLLRRYSSSDVIALVADAGAHCQDRAALHRALDSLDRLQNAIPEDESARQEKRRQSSRINSILDELP